MRLEDVIPSKEQQAYIERLEADVGAFAALIGNLVKLLIKTDNRAKELQRIVDQVDDVLVVNWVGPRVDGDYRQALADLITTNIEQHEYFKKEEEKEVRDRQRGEGYC